MKLVTYGNAAGGNNDRQQLGVLLDELAVLDVAAACRSCGLETPAFVLSMQALIEAGADALRLLAELVEARPADALRSMADLVLLAPLPRPVQMRDFANYELHVRQALATSMAMRAAQQADPQLALQQLKSSGAYDIPPVWYEMPLYFKCNRMSVVGPDADVIWPRYAQVMDYELEMGAVIGRDRKSVV